MSTQEPGARRVQCGGCANILRVTQLLSCTLVQVRIGGASTADPLNGAKARQSLAQRGAQLFGAWKGQAGLRVVGNAHSLILRGEL